MVPSQTPGQFFHPGFAVFDDLGAPAERWNRAILNVIGLDIARAVSKVLNLQGLAAGFDVSRHIELTFKDGFAATLWTRGDSPESMWLNKTLGVMSQQEEAATLARQTCGDRTVVDHLQDTVVRRLHSWAAPLEETAGTCEVSVNCCDPSAPVELGAVDKLPALTCGKERCESDLEVREHAVCAGFGKHFKTRRCPVAPSISDKHRSLGIGLRVSNIASIDVSKGTFFGDFDIHLYEQNEATTVETSENDDQCNFAGLAHSMDISDANAFWELFSISGLDAYPILSFQKSTDTEFVKFRGAVFFSTTLHSWPMDVQRHDD